MLTNGTNPVNCVGAPPHRRRRSRCMCERRPEARLRGRSATGERGRLGRRIRRLDRAGGDPIEGVHRLAGDVHRCLHVGALGDARGHLLTMRLPRLLPRLVRAALLASVELLPLLVGREGPILRRGVGRGAGEGRGRDVVQCGSALVSPPSRRARPPRTCRRSAWTRLREQQPAADFRCRHADGRPREESRASFASRASSSPARCLARAGRRLRSAALPRSRLPLPASRGARR